MRWEELEEKDPKHCPLSMMWEEMVDLKDAIFFVDLARDYSVFYNDSVASGLGGYIHIRDKMGKMMHSYNVEDKTISPSSMPWPTSHVSLWECRLERDHGKAVCTVDSERQEDKIMVTDDGNRFNHLPSHVLERIMDLCLGVEYMYFCATCKQFYSAAPLIQWSNKAAALNKYSVVSPWLMVIDEKQKIISYTDPLSGDKYFMKRSQAPSRHENIFCSRFGWILSFNNVLQRLVFFNPFTSDIRELPHVWPQLDTLNFSAPPTSSDCMVIGFTSRDPNVIYIYFQQSWRKIPMHFGGAHPYPFRFPTFYGQHLYALSSEGQYVFKNLVCGCHWEQVVATTPSLGQNFLVKCNQHLLLVVVGKFGESVVEVFKANVYTKEWEKIDSLGRHMIYICDTTSLCIEAKIPEMENKIYFARLHPSRNGKIVFYSLETCKYHMFNGGIKIQEISRVNGARHTQAHVWIEPNWSY